MSDRVRRYFDGAAERFDLIYTEDKNLSQRMVDRLFRGVIHHRFRLAIELCGNLDGKKVLDVGCGSGRYSIEFARRGAEVVGLDFAQGMIDLARQTAEADGVGDRCSFEQADFLTWSEPQKFDICLGIGFFDYIDEPGTFLEKMRGIVRERAIFSFPIRWTLRSPTRWMRLKMNDCPVYFYDEAAVMRLLRESGWSSLTVHHLSRDYLIDAQPD